MLVKRGAPSRGFSLIELAVALTVLGLLVLVVAPPVSDWVRNLRVRGATEAIQAGLQRARGEALRTNELVTFWLVSGSNATVVDDSCALSSGSGSWVVSRVDPTGACGAEPSTTVDPRIVQTHAAGQTSAGVTVAAIAADGTSATCVRFNGFGRVVDSTAGPDDDCRPPKQVTRIDVTHALGARSLRILVATGGGIRMCDPAVTDATDPRRCP